MTSAAAGISFSKFRPMNLIISVSQSRVRGTRCSRRSSIHRECLYAPRDIAAPHPLPPLRPGSNGVERTGLVANPLVTGRGVADSSSRNSLTFAAASLQADACRSVPRRKKSFPRRIRVIHLTARLSRLYFVSRGEHGMSSRSIMELTSRIVTELKNHAKIKSLMHARFMQRINAIARKIAFFVYGNIRGRICERKRKRER